MCDDWGGKLIGANETIEGAVTSRYAGQLRPDFLFKFRVVQYMAPSHTLDHRSLARNPDNIASTEPSPLCWLLEIAEVVAGGTLVGSAQAFL